MSAQYQGAGGMGPRAARAAARRAAAAKKRRRLASLAALLVLGLTSLLLWLFLARDGGDQPPPPPEVIARLTIPEGFTVRQVARRVEELGICSAEDFMAAATAGDYQLPILPVEQAGNLEGLLFPKTYDITENMQPRDLVRRLLDQFALEAASINLERSRELGITPYQAVIVASLIEREVVVEEERPLVAAVIYNRLRAGMRLQIDATVQYALPQWKERLTYEDLKVDSPYNTYLHAGLPPTPICNPGRPSLEAALAPAQVDYLYYVATGEGGRHFFTADYQEFLRAKNRVSP